MPTVARTFNFLTDAEGFQAFPGTFAAGGWDTANGTPAGSLKFTVTGKSRNVTSWWTWTGTWEQLGVPVGSIVTSIQLTSGWTRCVTYTSGATSTAGPYSIRDSADVLIGALWGGRTVTGTDAGTAIGSQAAVSISSHTSGTTVKLRLQNTLATNSPGSPVVQVNDDAVALLITYSLGLNLADAVTGTPRSQKPSGQSFTFRPQIYLSYGQVQTPGVPLTVAAGAPQVARAGNPTQALTLGLTVPDRPNQTGSPLGARAQVQPYAGAGFGEFLDLNQPYFDTTRPSGARAAGTPQTDSITALIYISHAYVQLPTAAGTALNLTDAPRAARAATRPQTLVFRATIHVAWAQAQVPIGVGSPLTKSSRANAARVALGPLESFDLPVGKTSVAKQQPKTNKRPTDSLTLPVTGLSFTDRPGQGRAKTCRPEKIIGWKSGAFLGGGGPAKMRDFGLWRGRPVEMVNTFSGFSNWGALEAPSTVLEWVGTEWQFGHRLILTTRTHPSNGFDATSTYALCASGSNDAHWQALATYLINNGMTQIWLCLNHEYNLNGSSVSINPGGAGDDSVNMRNALRRMVTVMRAVSVGGVSGQWKFMINPSNGTVATVPDPASVWPGDSYMDAVFLDGYDRWFNHSTATPQQVWDQLLEGGNSSAGGTRGINFWQAFLRAGASRMNDAGTGTTTATSQKAFGWREWGTWDDLDPVDGGQGDEPQYMQFMWDNLVAYELSGGVVEGETIFNNDSSDGVMHQIWPTTAGDPTWGDAALYDYTQAGTRYRQLWGSTSPLLLGLSFQDTPTAARTRNPVQAQTFGLTRVEPATAGRGGLVLFDTFDTGENDVFLLDTAGGARTAAGTQTWAAGYVPAPGPARASTPAQAAATGYVQAAAAALAGAPGQTLTLALALADAPTAARGGTPAQAFAGGATFTDTPRAARAGAPPQTLSNPVLLTITDSAAAARAGAGSGEQFDRGTGPLTTTTQPGQGRAAAPAQAVTFGLTLTDATTGAARAAFDQVPSLPVTATDGRAGQARAGAPPTQVVTYGLTFPDQAGGARGGNPPLPGSVSNADRTTSARAFPTVDLLTLGLTVTDRAAAGRAAAPGHAFQFVLAYTDTALGLRAASAAQDRLLLGALYSIAAGQARAAGPRTGYETDAPTPARGAVGMRRTGSYTTVAPAPTRITS